MKKLRTASVADLLEVLRTHPNEIDQCAAFFGYERRTPRPVPRPPLSDPEPEPSGQSQPKTEPPIPEIRFPTVRPSLKFLVPMRAEKLKEIPRQPVGNPITDDQLAIDWNQRGPRLQPLVRWSRIGSFLRNRLGRTTDGSRIDQRKLMRLAGSGTPLTELPRQRLRSWAPQAVVLWDTSPEMFPFTGDVKWLLDRLRGERGQYGLVVRELRGVPRVRDVAGVPACTPILALSAMGCFVQSLDITSHWVHFAKRLGDLGLNLLVLNPCPRDRWSRPLADACQSVVWDRVPRLPRNGGQRSVAPKLDQETSLGAVAEQLLTLLSTASFIESPLLRAARLKMGREANAGTEWDTWHHADCWQSLECFGLKAGEAYASRLEQRAQLIGKQAEFALQIGIMMADHHHRCSPVIRAEAELRACLTGSHSEVAMNKLKALLKSVVDRLRLEATRPGGASGEQSGLPTWFIGMVDRLSPTMRADSSISELLSQGLALAHTWSATPSFVVPAEMDREAFDRELRSVTGTLPNPVPFEISLHHDKLMMHPATESPSIAKTPIGRVRAGHGRVQIVVGDKQPISILSEPHTTTTTVLESKPARVIIETPYDRLHLETVERKVWAPWASRMWTDGFGLAAEFTIRDVPFVLRWIPPGTFMMGSPETEVGRTSWEGPQHEVTISHGFWIGETPVTQCQWKSVVEAGKGMKQVVSGRGLRPEPSHFKEEKREGKGELPVERVSWSDCKAFCNLLNELLGNGLVFRFPSEMVWEYACRAGTHSAFHDGSNCSVAKGFDPALDELGWFDDNSDHSTHFVKQKRPNNWGLFDTHGNVWEWCADVWVEDAMKKRAEGAFDSEKLEKAGDSRVLRGGAWSCLAQDCRASVRYYWPSGYGWEGIGFRLFAVHELEKV